MKRVLGACALSLVVASSSLASDQAIGNLLDAKTAAEAALRGASALDAVSAGSGVFDGAKGRSSAVPVSADRGGRLALAATTAAAAKTPVARASVNPFSARGISDGYLGLYPENEFVLGTGACASCRGPREGKWYFPDDLIATPKSAAPAIVWIGSHELIEGATLSEDGRSVRLQDGTVMPFALVPKIPSNRSYYDEASLAFFRGRTLRIRGEFAEINGRRTLVARTIWPEDFRLDDAGLKKSDARTPDDIDKLVASDGGGARSPFLSRLLWERPGTGRDWTGKFVMGFMANGAQGDDDESLAGHFSFFTGRYGPNGSMADWMFDNFYDMDVVNEKAITAAMVPMDKYMADLNSGQSWYRPTDMVVLILKDERAPLEIQKAFKELYARFYAHDVKYEHTHENCTALIADTLRKDGWNYPKTGGKSWVAAEAIRALVLAKTLGDTKAASQVYDTLREEPTREFPRVSFDAAAGDALTLAGAPGAKPLERKLTPLERLVREDLIAVVFVRLPQIPSSRKFGRDPAKSIFDFEKRVPSDRSQWQIVPTTTRPFPPN